MSSAKSHKEEKLSAWAINEIEKAREEYRRGNYITLGELRKRLSRNVQGRTKR